MTVSERSATESSRTVDVICATKKIRKRADEARNLGAFFRNFGKRAFETRRQIRGREEIGRSRCHAAPPMQTGDGLLAAEEVGSG